MEYGATVCMKRRRAVLKALGLFFVAAAAVCAAGMCAAAQRERAELLSAMAGAVSLLRLELCERLQPLPQTLEKLAQEKQPRLRAFFAACAEDMSGCASLPFAEIWLRRAREQLSARLGEEELAAFCELGRFLGRYEAGEQRRELEKAEERFEAFRERERTQGAARGKLKAALSLCAGAAAVIMLL